MTTLESVLAADNFHYPYPKPVRTLRNKPKVKNERKALSNKLDTLVSKICRKLGHCEVCGKSDGILNAHHFKSRRLHGLRWYLPNLICLCVHHHVFDHEFSAHKTPEAFKERMTEIKGSEWRKDIELRAIGSGNIKLDEMRMMYQELSTLWEKEE